MNNQEGSSNTSDNNTALNLNLNQNAMNNSRLMVFSQSFNILRIMSGIGGIAYSDGSGSSPKASDFDFIIYGNKEMEVNID